MQSWRRLARDGRWAVLCIAALLVSPAAAQHRAGGGGQKPLPAKPAAAAPAATAAANAEPDNVRALIAAYNDSGQRLFRVLAGAPGNIVLSPYSVGTAMAMVLAGARGGNATEMAEALGQRLPLEQINTANAAVLAILDGYNGATDPKAAVQLRVANALMLTRLGDAILPAYVDLVKDKYAAEVFRGVDLAQVNDWVKQKTDGKIDAILDQLDSNALAIVLNAIAFKAPWRSPFDPQATRDEPFQAASGEVQVPMMHLRGEYALAVREGYRAIRLPYGNEHLAMVVALPDDVARTNDVSARIDGTELAQMLEALRAPGKLVDLAMPRFTARYKAGLVEAFQQLGMHKAFDTQTADFSGMTGKPQVDVPVAIDQIMHRAVIEVAEEGTEAAAASGVVMGLRSVRPPAAESFRIDRPFLFYIVEDATGAVLFQGRIVDPRPAG